MSLVLRILLSALLWVTIRDAVAYIPPPEPIAIHFQKGTDRLARAGEISVDRLAVLAAGCGPDVLTLSVLSAKGEAAAPRADAIRARLERLGLRVRIGAWNNRADQEVPPRRRDEVLAEVARSGEGEYCYGYVLGGATPGSTMHAWIEALGNHVERPSEPMPSFWRGMSPEARLGDLALPMAVTALCPSQAGCFRRPKLAVWLATQALRGAPTQKRREWLISLWPFAEEGEPAALQRLLGLKPLTPEERASVAEALVRGNLAWETIERRLLAPGVMQAFAVAPPMGDAGPGYGALLGAAQYRNQLASFGRLVAAAGRAKACFIDDALYRAAAIPTLHDALAPQFLEWARSGAIPPFQHPQAMALPCNPTATLLWAAYCDDDEENRARASRTWRQMLDAGFKPHQPTVGRLTTHGAPDQSPRWKLERVTNDNSEFRCMRLGDPTTMPP